MKRLLLIGTKFPRLKSIEWYESVAHNILDYQGLLFDCRKIIGYAEQVSLSRTLIPFVQSDHTIYIVLPHKMSIFSSRRNLDFIPDCKITVEKAEGTNCLLVRDEPPFNAYHRHLKRHTVVFSVEVKRQGMHWLRAIEDNVHRGICGKIGESIYVLQPPPHGAEQPCLRVIIDHFKPDFEIPEVGPSPDWSQQIITQIPGIEGSNKKIAELSKQIERLGEERQAELESKKQLEEWVQLLWLSGVPLQERVRDALRFLGFDIEPGNDTGHTPDIVAKQGSYVFVIEITGSTGTITIDKGRQLMEWVIAAEPKEVRGVLVGNAFRNDPPEKRPPSANHNIFAAELEKMAKKRGLALLETRELFRIVCAKLGGTKFPLEKICEDLSTDGEVHFRL
jgi:hypothetical protein